MCSSKKGHSSLKRGHRLSEARPSFPARWPNPFADQGDLHISMYFDGAHECRLLTWRVTRAAPTICKNKQVHETYSIKMLTNVYMRACGLCVADCILIPGLERGRSSIHINHRHAAVLRGRSHMTARAAAPGAGS